MIKISYIYLIALFSMYLFFTHQVLGKEENHSNNISVQDQTPVAIYKTEGGLYLIAGNSYSSTKGPGSWLWKIDRNGNKVKEKYLDQLKGNLQDVIVLEKNEIRLVRKTAGITFKTNDGKFLDVISTNNNNDFINTRNNIQLIKRDGSGKILWELKHGGFGEDNDVYVFNGINSKEGSYIFLVTEGKYNKFGAGPSSVWILKCDSYGNIITKMKFPNGRINFKNNNYITLNDNKIVFSYSTSELPSCDNVPVNLSFGAKIVGLDYNLEKLWEKALLGYSSMIPPLVTTTSDGNFLVAGAVDKGPKIIKISPDGEIQWEKTYQKKATNNLSYNIIGIVAHNNICIIVGTVSDFMKDSNNRVFLLKIDTMTSNSIWQKNY